MQESLIPATYILFTIFYKLLFYLNVPRFVFLLIPILIIHIKFAYDMKKESQLSLKESLRDNFSKSNSPRMFVICLLNSLIHNILFFILYKMNSDSIFINSKIYAVIVSLIFSFTSFLQGRIYSYFIPNMNSEKKFDFKKYIVCLCTMISVLPLIMHSEIGFFENIAIGISFLSIAGYIDGCIFNLKRNDSRFNLLLPYILRIIAFVFFMVLITNNLSLCRKSVVVTLKQ